MAFGLSFGASKNKGSSDTKINKTETTTQNKTGSQTTQGTTTNSQTGSQSTNQTTSGSTAQTGSSTTQGNQTGQTQQTSALFSDDVQSGLEGAVMQLLGSTVGNRTQVGNFDPERFVAGALDSARSTQALTLEDSLNKTFADIGGTSETNSASAILANSLRGQAASNLAGVEANLNAQANQITRDNMVAGAQIDSTTQQFLSSLLGQLKGGQATTTGTEQTATSQTGTQQSTGTQAQTQTGTTQTAQQSTETQNLIQLINELLNGTTNTTGTESTKTKGSKIGGGASLSI